MSATSRDPALVLVSLLACVGSWVAYLATRPETTWAWVMLAALAASVFFAIRSSRPGAPPRPRPARSAPGVADEMRATYHTQDGRLSEMEKRLALQGIGLDWKQAGADTAFRRGLVKASLELGLAQLEAGAVDDAMATFESALADLGDDPALNRTRAGAHALRALAHERRAEKDLARSDYRRALELDPDQRLAREGLSRLG
jgi:tetratricopeptide (TPR) repeat protein